MIKNPIVNETVDLPTQNNKSKFRLPRVRVPLRAKITLPFLILAVGLAIAAAYVITQIVFDTIDERYTNQLIESGKLSSEGMVRQEESLLRSLRLFSHSSGLPEAIIANDVAELENLSLGIAANQGEEVVEFLDKEGQLVLSLRRRPGGEAADYDISTQSDFAYQNVTFINNVLEGKIDDLGDKYSGLVKYGWDDLFFVAGPLYDDRGDFVGAVLVGKALDSLLRQIHDETLAQVTIYSEEGLPVASTFYEPAELNEEQAISILENQDISSLKRKLGDRRGLNVSNIDYDEILGAWEGRGDEDLGLIGVALPRTFLVRASNATRMQITGLATLTLMLVLLMGIYIASIITRPLRTLVEASAQVAEGDLDVQIEPKGNDEVAVLSKSFNHMVSSLNQSKIDLLNAYDSTLEGWSLLFPH